MIIICVSNRTGMGAFWMAWFLFTTWQDFHMDRLSETFDYFFSYDCCFLQRAYVSKGFYYSRAEHIDNTGNLGDNDSHPCWLTFFGLIVFAIVCEQALNKDVESIFGRQEKGLGDIMFLHGLIELARTLNDVYIYAECVKTGLGTWQSSNHLSIKHLLTFCANPLTGNLVWKTHVMQETCVGNFIYLQLACCKGVDLGCQPKTLHISSS